MEKNSNTGRAVTNWQDKWDVRVSLTRHGLEMIDRGEKKKCRSLNYLQRYATIITHKEQT